ncbi:MAG: hypothetical protein ACKOFX_08125, partial [Solirubrobacterales bacterium]
SIWPSPDRRPASSLRRPTRPPDRHSRSLSRPAGSVKNETLAASGAQAADLQIAALVAVGQRVGIAIGCVDLVVESAYGVTTLDDDQVMAKSIRIGRAVGTALESLT